MFYQKFVCKTVLAKAYKQSIINQYKQQRRWDWGCENISYLLFNFLKNKKVKSWIKLKHALEQIDSFYSWATASLMIFALG